MAWHVEVTPPGLPTATTSGGLATESEAEDYAAFLASQEVGAVVVEIAGAATSYYSGGMLHPLKEGVE